MGDLTPILGAMSPSAVATVTQFEDEVLKLPQVQIDTQHAFHAGMYARTIKMAKDVILTGALIKIPTMLILNGDALVYREDGAHRYTGHHVLLGAAGRKTAFVALEDTYLTMVFPSEAKTVEEAEAEFTDDADRLMSRQVDAVNTFAMEA